jgi:hypothetical protein
VEQLPERIDVADLPPYVEIWSVAKIPNFMQAVLGRWQRARGELPSQFYVLMCPQVEVNAVGGLPARVIELTDPRLRCHHFTGCHKPYFVVFFVGEDADRRRAEVQGLLSWSESYRVDIGEDAIRLAFVDATEDADEDEERDKRPPPRTLRELLATGEIVSILE